jgi:Flp pilus assembly protein TadG
MGAMQRWKRRLADETGQVLVMAALSMTALLGFAALATDVGVLFRTRRNVQIATDAAAIAGSVDYLYNGTTTSAIAAAKAASAANGITDGTGSAVVTVNIPPAGGPNAGNAAFVEAIVSKPKSTIFMGVFGIRSMTVNARAVAGTPTYGQACIWLMKNSGMALDLQGNYDIEAPSCGIYVNSTSANALSVTGNGGTVNAKFLDVVGSSTSPHATAPTEPTLNAAPRKSPWGNLTGPTEGNGGCTTIDKTTTTVTGDVSGSAPGLGHAICYQKAVTLSGATLGPGVYMFENGVTISGTVTENGGTLDIYGGSFNQPSNTLLNITAPTSGTYNGIAIMQPSNNTNDLQVQFGSNNQTLDGYIYAPGAEVYLQDHGGGITATGIVAATMFDKASVIRIPSYDAAHPTTTVNRVVTLVE